MCGISAIVSEQPHDVGRLLRMHAPIAHRGPDGEGFLAITRDASVIRSSVPDDFRRACSGRDVVASIAFRWLKIQDTSDEAMQPMSLPDGSVWIALNGEIYNYPELRAQLAAKGCPFRTHSDTEVALAAYAEWGVEAFEKFNGMWAILLVDLRRRQLVVSRDRVGIKPLFMARQDGQLLLASEPKQIACSGAGRPRADVDSLVRYVSNHRPARGHSFFDGVTSFPAATFAVLELGAEPQIAPRRYWDLAAVRVAEGMTFDRAVDRVEEVVSSSVRMHLLAEVPVGTLLSGGLDSSLVTALAARLTHPRPAFSFVLPLPQDRHLDESRFMDDVVAAAEVPSHRTTLTPEWLVENFDRVTAAQDAPVTGLPVVAQFRTHEVAAREGMRVVLDGQGADEIFAGYQRHQAIYLNELLRAARAGAFVSELVAFSRGNRRYPLTYVRQGLLAPLRAMIQPPHRRTPPWLKVDMAESAEGRASVRGLQEGLYQDVTEVNIPTVLGITDRNSMAHSLEARVPLLDHRLIELAFALPSSYKTGAGVRKRVLRAVAERHVPASVTGRRDSIGFGTPQARWMREELSAAMREAQNDEVFRGSGSFDAAAVAAERSPSNLWMIYALRSWLRRFAVVLP